MLRLFICLSIVAAGFLACSKNDSPPADEAQLYGAWAKGTHAGDTIWFMQKNGKNIMRSNQSFNASLPNYVEEEYTFSNGALSRLPTGAASGFSYPMTSFAWTQTGKEFTILSYHVYIFLSSLTQFTYKKI